MSVLEVNKSELAKGGNALSRGFGTVTFIVLVIWTIDALFLQAQMALLGSTPLPNLLVKGILALAILVGGLGRAVSGHTAPVPRPIFVLWIVFSIYLMLETILLVVRFGYSADYVMFSYNAYYFPVLLLPIMFYLRGILDEFRIVHILITFFVPVGFFGIAQNLSSSHILPTESPNGYLEVGSWDFFGSVRAFSFFQEPSYFGHFIALMGGLGAALYLGDKSKKKGIFLVLLSIASGYCTLTRATQLEIACVLFTVWMFYRRSRYRRILSLLPLIYGALGAFVAFAAPIVFSDLSANNILSNWSILERYMEWAQYGALWAASGLPTFLFGAGIAQNERFLPGQDVILDNSFLGVGVHIGAIGLILWFLVTWWLWTFMLHRATECVSPARAAALGAWSAWLFCSVFNILLFLPLPFLVFLFSDANGRDRHSYSRARRQHNAGQGPSLGEGPVTNPA